MKAVWLRFLSNSLWINFLMVFTFVLRAGEEPPPLPGPGLDLPVDLDGGGANLLKNTFAVIEDANPEGQRSINALEFDPYSASLFVSEDRAFVSESPPNSARIWRIDSAGNEELFATGLNFPNGMSFHSGGTMLISEDQNLLVADTWRNFFRRGDANENAVITLKWRRSSGSRSFPRSWSR